MRRNNLAFVKTLPVVVLVAVMFATVFFAVSESAFAESAPVTVNATDEITVGHISDIHYFPLEHCYTDVDSDNYKDSDFYYSMTGDTKLVLESGTILNANIRRIVEDAKKGTAPLYVFATGDLSKNGERQALIDVANALRYLQNSVRALATTDPKLAAYANFQVFVTPGNHDLYNGSGALYTSTDGSSVAAEAVSSAQFALIFAGLGFPDASYDGSVGINLSEIYPEESYWASSYTDGYVTSKNADNLTITYFNDAIASHATDAEWYVKVGDYINTLSYRVEIAGSDYVFFGLDGADREPAESSFRIRVNRAQFDAMVASGVASKYSFSTLSSTENDYFFITASSVSSYLAEGKAVYVSSPYNHITGGRIVQPVLDWISAFTTAPENSSKTYLAAYHHNALPHFEQEDDILKDFVFYNWEHVAKTLLESNVRYALAGHMHASDVASYTDPAGRTFYELETGSSVSYDSPVRYITIARYALPDGAVAESFTTSLHILDNIKEVASTSITSGSEWNQAAFEAANGDWDKVIAANPDFFVYNLHYDALSVQTYNEYITDEIYGTLAERIVDHFVNVKTIENLNIAETVKSVLPAAFETYADTLSKMADYLVDTLLYGLYPDGKYPYNGKTYDGAIEYLNAIIADLLGMKFGASGKELTLSQMASFIMMAHTGSLEPTTEEVFGGQPLDTEGTAMSIQPDDPVYRARFIAALRDFSEQCDSGELGRKLFTTLLNPLYFNEDSLLKTLLNFKFDFVNGAAFTDTDTYNLDSVIDLLEGMIATRLPEDRQEDFSLEISPDNFVLVKVADGAWDVITGLLDSLLGFSLPGSGIISALDGFLDAYLVDSFYIGLSGIAKNIVVAFATDDVRDIAADGNPETPFTITPYDGYGSGYVDANGNKVVLTYISDAPVADEFNPATTENGRLPSALTANFSTEKGKSGSEFNVSFYTGEDIGAEVTLYDANGNLVAEAEITVADMNASSDKRFRTVTANGGNNILLKGETRAQYIPLIDLGLLCLQHAEIEYETEEGEVIEYGYTDRDDAPGNSVLYRNRFTVTFYGLEAGKTYYYSVSGRYTDGGADKTYPLADSEGNAKFALTTAPDDSVTDFDFVAIADMQGMIASMYDKAAATVRAIDKNAGEYGFVLNAGDMTDNGKNFYQWQWALDYNLDFFAGTSSFNAAGNHESGTDALSRFYTYALAAEAQGDAPVYAYSFDYATAHVIVLDTNDANSKTGLNEAQFNWLKSDLEANKDAKWTFVLMHKSLYSAGSHSYDGEVVAMRAQLVPLFYEYGVDIVFGGHDHTYTVTKFLDGEGKASKRKFDSDNSVTADGKGVLYVTLGTVGTKYYEYTDANDIVTDVLDKSRSIFATLEEPTFAKVSVKGEVLTFEGYTVHSDGSVSVIDNGDNLLWIALGVSLGLAALQLVVVLVCFVRKKTEKPRSDKNKDAQSTPAEN